MDKIDPYAQAEEQRTSPPSATYREISPGLEDRLFTPVPVLDHGFVRVVDYMGNDSSVVQAARVSYGRGTKQVSEDRGLINYLLRHRHTTPFEMAEIKLHVKLPIFVARQWIRHRTASVNEYSARYSVLDREFYVPAPEHLASQSISNRQGRGQVLSGDEAERALTILKETAQRSYDEYLTLLNLNEDGTKRTEHSDGLARELARANLTVGFYTQWYWKVNLHNLMGFLQLRADPHAQYEIRSYADVILDIMSAWVPLTYEAFLEHRLQSATFSSTAVKVIRRMLAGEAVTEESSGLGRREWIELSEILR
ncbi:FAD-dependent thymidylate synthase [Mesorhizobium sp. ES1-1]|uniref:FAD-dependent thymidylate synthase n=1 Tax=Mesorhizobium sp. ES1-1 TaxID=2876629 RepID=UPI001CCDE6C2|nr:FAD-dependent thymidylate synthase [Mesorhizobium sp. ES1-1]MBZ9677814.1 FAD-dependent thymidylate synthase [Mesorhizobium sp. ES1-1]